MWPTCSNNIQNYRLKVLSPLHIGTGEKLSGKEYYIHSDRVHIVDIPSLLKSNDDKIDKIIELHSNEENHILKLKKQLIYLVQSKYNFDLQEFKKI